MFTERDSFGACFMNNHIFTTGGYTKDNNKTKKCEKFEVI